MPYWPINRIGRSFILPLTRSISDRVDEFRVAYIDGQPGPELNDRFSFHKLDMPYGFVRSKVARFFMSRGKLESQVRDIDADVVFALSDLWMQEFSRYVSKKLDIPYAIRLRGNHREVRRSTRINAAGGRILDWLETRSLRDADLVIPSSKELAGRAVQWRVKRERITLPIYNGIDTHMFRPMRVEKPNDLCVAYAGRISSEKRVQHLLRILGESTKTRIMIAGKNDMNIAFPGNVEYYGELPFPEMPRFYNRADLILLPSATEGFPNVLLEAYACGKPVLVAKEAFPEELEVFGSVANLDDFKSEVEALRKRDLKALGQQARLYVEKHYSWGKFAQSVVELLERVVDAGVD